MTTTTAKMTFEQACDILRPKKTPEAVAVLNWDKWGSDEQKRALKAWKSGNLPKAQSPTAAPSENLESQPTRPRFDLSDFESFMNRDDWTHLADRINYHVRSVPGGLEAQAFDKLDYDRRMAIIDAWSYYPLRSAIQNFYDIYEPLVIEHLVMEAWLNPESGLCRFIKQGLTAYPTEKQLLFRTPPDSLNPGTRTELIAFLSNEYEAMQRGVPRAHVRGRRKR